MGDENSLKSFRFQLRFSQPCPSFGRAARSAIRVQDVCRKFCELTWFPNTHPRLLRVRARLGCSRPRTFSFIAWHRSKSGPASAYLPWMRGWTVRHNYTSVQERFLTTLKKKYINRVPLELHLYFDGSPAASTTLPGC